MVRNLASRKRRPQRPIRSWRKKTGPLESSLIASAMTANRGAASSSTRQRADDVHGPLQEAGGAGEDRRVDAENGHALDVVDLDRGAQRIEQLGQDADLHAVLPRATDQVEERILLEVLPRDHDPLGSVALDRFVQLRR